MIVSVSRRTDIIALYSEWFAGRVKEGYCTVANPYNKQTYKVSLKEEDVDFFAFWTRYPKPILKYLHLLKNYKYYFMITLNNYPKEFEPYSPISSKVIESIKILHDKIGPRRIIWRYDPIILTTLTDEKWHIDNFGKILSNINKNISKIIISFVDIYKKNGSFFNLMKNKYSLKLFPPESFLKETSKIAEEYGISIQTCSENMDLKRYGIEKGACIDPKVLNIKKDYPRDPYQREACLCRVAKDIGFYDSCIFGCKYCYATNYKKALKNYKAFIKEK